MKRDLTELKLALPLDALLNKLGHGDKARKSARCPLHEDTRNSFSVYDDGTGELRWKCHAGCGGGDVIDFVRHFFNLPDAKHAIEHYAILAGHSVYTDAIRSFRGTAKPAKVAPEPQTNATPARLEPLGLGASEQIAKWRGLHPAFLREMSELGIFGLYDNKPAFKTEGGVQYRVPNDGWRFSAGAKNSILVIGHPAKDKILFVVESNWDALAIYEAVRMPVICTRGASNARLAIDYINELSGGESMRVCCFPHNDRAGEDFANDLRAGLMLHDFVIKHVPSPHKDFNEYHKNAKERLTINGRNL